MNNTDYLKEFDDDVTVSTTIPYLQIQNPPNIALSQIKKLNPPWGWFVPNDQSELVNFTPNDRFVPTRLTFGEDTATPREVDGWLTRRPRCVIIYRSAAIEVQEKSKNGWRFVGEAYRSGAFTDWGEKANSDKENYRLRTRFLLLFVDDNNEPLHQSPLRLGLGRGTGGSFGSEVKIFRSEIERVFFKLREQAQKSLFDCAHALAVLDLELGVHKGDGKAPFVTPIRRLAPAVSDVGIERVSDRGKRKITLIGTPIESLLISKNSDAGRLILQLREDYADFPKQYRDDLAPVPVDKPPNTFVPTETNQHGDNFEYDF
jgi:Family of unknown function (DUF5895)